MLINKDIKYIPNFVTGTLKAKLTIPVLKAKVKIND